MENINMKTWLNEHFDLSPETVDVRLGNLPAGVKAVIMFETPQGGLFNNVGDAKLSVAKTEFEKAVSREFPNDETQAIMDFVESVAAIRERGVHAKLGKDQVVIRDFLKDLANGL